MLITKIYNIFYILTNEKEFYKYDINNDEFLEKYELSQKNFFKELKKNIISLNYRNINNIFNINFNNKIVLDILNRKKLKNLYPYHLKFYVDYKNLKESSIENFKKFLKINNYIEEDFYKNFIELFNKRKTNNYLIIECNSEIKEEFLNLFFNYIEDSYLEEILDLDFFDFKNYELYGKEFLIYHNIEILKNKKIFNIAIGKDIVEKTSIFPFPFLYQGKNIIFINNNKEKEWLEKKLKKENIEYNYLKFDKMLNNKFISEDIFIYLLKYLLKFNNISNYEIKFISKDITKQFLTEKLETIQLKNLKVNKQRLYKEYLTFCKLFNYKPIKKTTFLSYITLLNNKINNVEKNIIKSYYIK